MSAKTNELDLRRPGRLAVSLARLERGLSSVAHRERRLLRELAALRRQHAARRSSVPSLAASSAS
jgi:hypothetical protein